MAATSVMATKAKAPRKPVVHASVRFRLRSRHSSPISGSPAHRCRPIPPKAFPTPTSPISTLSSSPGPNPSQPNLSLFSTNSHTRPTHFSFLIFKCTYQETVTNSRRGRMVGKLEVARLLPVIHKELLRCQD